MRLVEFLLARFAEDEARSRPGPEPEAWCDRSEGAHYEHARVLAECEAKRRIVEVYRREADITARTPASGPKTPQEARSGALGEACLLLALPYADHPDYRPEWKP